ncbi:prolyl oligopeptidase family serine peptidase [Cryobacterium sp. PH29-G1]|uniref:prolyl oligopeptidase family serine peptidase n=1 Tax=Cryobacterium sp. PH29-G1 TaxID=3046211 RepID=UPI0024B8A880|nr:prolyl oligopeptidase family serine peptidase [Cryobacterium sp. PH29-G1]MDJ0350251.1 prolyl oligopeptidase family serine peptidase [Cryobacterium sp. PH29-G1]
MTEANIGANTEPITETTRFEQARDRWVPRAGLVRALAAAENYDVPGLPVLHGQVAFSLSRLAGDTHHVLRSATLNRETFRFEATRTLLDPQLLDPTGATVVSTFSVSPTGGYVVVQLSVAGSEVGTLHVVDCATLVRRVIPNAAVRYPRVDWRPDGTGFRCPAWAVATAPRTIVCTLEPHLTVGSEPESDAPRGVNSPPAAALEPPSGYPGAHLRGVAEAGAGNTLALWTHRSASVLSVHRSGVPGTVLDLGLGALVHVEEIAVHTQETDSEAWLVASNLSTPPRLYRRQLPTDVPATGHRANEDSASRPADSFVHQRLVATMDDGVEVDLLVSARRDDLDAEGLPRAPRPVILTAYGGFGVSSGPRYEPSLSAWLCSGGIFVTAQVRGGGERGAAWHRAGSGPHKSRSVRDLIGCADSLVRGGWCTRASLCLMGASHGGLIVTAAALQRPDLCAAVVCTAPLLNLVDYHRHGLGARWIDEFGDPDDRTDRARLLEISPLHLLAALPVNTPLPAVLCAVFEADDRIPPVHALAFVEALGAHGGQSWLRSESAAGHGSKPLDRVREFSADVLAFAAVHTACDAPDAGFRVARRE